jgi:nucleotide-binding universal stress UspA family protein
MKRILVPTDFSDCASKAAKTAIEIAKKSGAEIHFLHFMSIPVNWLRMEKDQDDVYPDINNEIKQANHQLEELVKIAGLEDVPARYFLGYNECSSNIIDHIKAEQIDLVVMGSHGASGVRELFIGSNAQKIVRLSPVPVLIIKKDNGFEEIKDIIFVSDFEIETIKPYEGLINYAEIFGARLHLLYINTPSYFNDTWEVEEKMEPFKSMGGDLIESCNIINSYIFEDGLNRYCEKFDNALIAMATHGRKGVSRIFYGSVTEKVVNHSFHPVLSLKIPQEIREVYLETR